MKVSIIGTGYVGLVTGTCFAELGHEVVCIDKIEAKIAKLNLGESPIYEPGLIEMIERNRRHGRLSFSVGLSSIESSDVVFIAVGTPPKENGDANLEFLFGAVRDCVKVMSEGSILVVKSTVPVGTSKKVREEIKKITSKNIYLVSNPEFLKEGVAINDFMRPDRVVVGADSEFSFQVMEELYAPLVRQGNPIIKMRRP